MKSSWHMCERPQATGHSHPLLSQFFKFTPTQIKALAEHAEASAGVMEGQVDAALRVLGSMHTAGGEDMLSGGSSQDWKVTQPATCVCRLIFSQITLHLAEPELSVISETVAIDVCLSFTVHGCHTKPRAEQESCTTTSLSH